MSVENDIARAPLRVGLIGLGKMGRHHLKAIAASGTASVVGVADPAASPEELGPELPPGAIVVKSAEELLERARPDVVHIVTPPASHASLGALALEAGAHVYIEKPFTPTAAEAEALLQLAAARGRLVCAGHQVLFERPSLALRDALPGIGDVVHIESYFSFKTVRRTITPGDQLRDILPHAVYPVVDQLRLGKGLVDEPIELEGCSLDATGNVYALLRLGAARAVVMVTLNGRPVEQYQTVVGTNGSLRADYIGGHLVRLTGPGTGPGVLLTPYRRALQTTTGTTRGIFRLLRGGSYPGLRTLIARFYESIRNSSTPPMTPGSILDTVRLCENIGRRLGVAEVEMETAAEAQAHDAERLLPRVDGAAPLVLLTGGTGLLGRRTAEELRRVGLRVRVVARRVPPWSRRVPGVEYAAADLAGGVDPSTLAGVHVVVHAAAETAGGKTDHQRNSIDATRLLIAAAAHAGVRRFIHISSLAVLKTSREVGRALDENVAVDVDNVGRGPYVWGKAVSEVVAQEECERHGVSLKIVRPGPLVDYSAYQPPGRLGREVGPLYVAIGPKRGALSVCDVGTAARVIQWYIDEFDEAPPLLNLVEAPPPTRRDLMERYVRSRPDLRVFWMPAWFLRMLSGPLRLVQRVALGSKAPVDVAAAFASERYVTDLAAQVIRRADMSSEKETAGIVS